MTIDRNRTFRNIDRRLNGGDGQGRLHFTPHLPVGVRVSDSPRVKAAVFDQIHTELTAVPSLAHGSLLISDESADAKARAHNAEATRQYSERLDKVDVCRVDTCLTGAMVKLGRGRWWVVSRPWPDQWSGVFFAERRRTSEVLERRVSQSEIEFGLRMIRRARVIGAPFERLGCNAFYGKDSQFRAGLQAKNVQYAAVVPTDTCVYLRPPWVGVPRKRHARSRPPALWKGPSLQFAREIRAPVRSWHTAWQHLRLRPTERGRLEAEFAVQPEWTITDAGPGWVECLVIRCAAEGDGTSTWPNEPPGTPSQRLAVASCGHYFIERLYEDGKTGLGWEEFQAQKYRASEQGLTLTTLAW